MQILKVDMYKNSAFYFSHVLLISMYLKLRFFSNTSWTKIPKSSHGGIWGNLGSEFSSTYFDHHKSLKTRTQDLPFYEWYILWLKKRAKINCKLNTTKKNLVQEHLNGYLNDTLKYF